MVNPRNLGILLANQWAESLQGPRSVSGQVVVKGKVVEDKRREDPWDARPRADRHATIDPQSRIDHNPDREDGYDIEEPVWARQVINRDDQAVDPAGRIGETQELFGL